MNVLQFNEVSNNNDNQVSTLKEDKIAKVYRSFLSTHKSNSKQTAKAYHERVTEFFELILDKQIEFISEQDVLNIERADIQNNYIDYLRWKGNSNNTIKTKLNSVRSFYNELLINNVILNPSILKFKLKDDVTHHEAMSNSELDKLYEHMLNERNLSLEKYLLSKTFLVTANRRSEVFGMTWKNSFSIKTDVNTGEEVHVIQVMSKGAKHRESPISKEFYEELQQLNDGREKVFNMSEKTFERSLDRFSNQINKKITMHSFKATAITLGYRATKDLEMVRQLGNHENILTTQKIYLKEEKSLVNQLSYHVSRNNDINLDEVSYTDLLDVIKNNHHLKEGVIMALRNKIN